MAAAAYSINDLSSVKPKDISVDVVNELERYTKSIFGDNIEIFRRNISEEVLSEGEHTFTFGAAFKLEDGYSPQGHLLFDADNLVEPFSLKLGEEGLLSDAELAEIDEKNLKNVKAEDA
jgi:hypothetical protein